MYALTFLLAWPFCETWQFQNSFSHTAVEVLTAESRFALLGLHGALQQHQVPSSLHRNSSSLFESVFSSLMTYLFSSSQGDQDDRSFKQYRTSSPSSAGSLGYGRYTPTSHSPQHYSRPGN